MMKIDLNCDMGESFGSYTIGCDELVLSHITSANIACGWHGGDSTVMQKTVELCVKNSVAIGAHPGLPDLVGFGRRNMSITPSEGASYVTYQVGALMAFCTAQGAKMQHVKPHGALYNMAAKDFELSLAICTAIQSIDKSLIIMAPFGSQTIKAAQQIGLKYASEVFADRAYMPDGSLVPRTQNGAMIEDEQKAQRRVLKMAIDGCVEDIDGNILKIAAHSICVHGDSAHALDFVKKIKEGLFSHGVCTAPLSEVLK